MHKRNTGKNFQTEYSQLATFQIRLMLLAKQSRKGFADCLICPRPDFDSPSRIGRGSVRCDIVVANLRGRNVCPYLADSSSFPRVPRQPM